MNSIGAIKTMDSDEKQLQESVRYVKCDLFSIKFTKWFLIISISDILASAIRLCVYPIDFSIYAACPRAHDTNRELSVSSVFFSLSPSSNV